MILRAIKRKTVINVLLWSVLVIVVIINVIIWFPRTPKVLSADELYQLQLAVAQRTCDKVNKLTDGLSNDPPLTASDCIPPNQYCGRTWGADAVWAGSSDENGTPVCSCDEGYIWRNDDGTIGTSFGTSETFNFISAPGRCARQQ
jgi:hypothetical protein